MNCPTFILALTVGFLFLETSGRAQTTSRTTSRSLGSTSLRGSTGMSQASQQLGTVLTPQDFGMAGSGNLLRSAVAAQSMGGNGGFNQFGGGGFGRGQFGQFGGQNQFGNQFGNQGATQGRPQLKIPLRIGTDITSRTPTGVPVGVIERFTTFETRLTKIPGLQRVRGVSATLDGRTVTLSGTVASARERDLLGDLALLEPGVDEVQNDLQVVKKALLPSPAP